MKLIANKFTGLLAAFIWMLLPLIGSAQGIGGPGGGGGTGGNPDKPADVPLSGPMSWLLIAAGVVLAVVVLRRVMHEKLTVTQK
jgi:hypothetical protein